MNETLWNIYERVISLTQGFLAVWFICKVNDFKLNTSKNKGIFCFIGLMFSLSNILFNIIKGHVEGVLFFIYPIELFIFSIIFFKSKMYKKVFGSVSSVLIIAISSYIAISLVTLFSGNDDKIFEIHNIYRFSALLLAPILLCTLLNLALVFWKKEKVNLLKYEWLSICLLFALSATEIVLLIEVSQNQALPQSSKIILFIVGNTFIIIDILTFAVIFRLSKIGTLKYENDKMKKTEFYQKKYAENLKSEYENIKLLRHDMKNIINIISKLLDEGKITEAKSLLDSYNLDIKQSEVFVNTDDIFVNSVLNIKISKIKNLKIPVNYHVANVFSGYENADMCYLLGNLLDNAIEATSSNEDGHFIDIFVDGSDIQIEICIKNTVLNLTNQKLYIESGTICKNNISFKTTKVDKENHGFGLKSIKRIADKYNGNADFYIKENIFIALVILKNPNYENLSK